MAVGLVVAVPVRLSVHTRTNAITSLAALSVTQ